MKDLTPWAFSTNRVYCAGLPKRGIRRDKRNERNYVPFGAFNSGIYRRAQLVLREWGITRLLDLSAFSA
jgi:hypothetical protein